MESEGRGKKRRKALSLDERRAERAAGDHPLQRSFQCVPVYHRSSLKSANVVQGPAIIAEDETTTIVTSGFSAAIDPSGAIRLIAKARTETKSHQEATQ